MICYNQLSLMSNVFPGVNTSLETYLYATEWQTKQIAMQQVTSILQFVKQGLDSRSPLKLSCILSIVS